MSREPAPPRRSPRSEAYRHAGRRRATSCRRSSPGPRHVTSEGRCLQRCQEPVARMSSITLTARTGKGGARTRSGRRRELREASLRHVGGSDTNFIRPEPGGGDRVETVEEVVERRPGPDARIFLVPAEMPRPPDDRAPASAPPQLAFHLLLHLGRVLKAGVVLEPARVRKSGGDQKQHDRIAGAPGLVRAHRHEAAPWVRESVGQGDGLDGVGRIDSATPGPEMRQEVTLEEPRRRNMVRGQSRNIGEKEHAGQDGARQGWNERRQERAPHESQRQKGKQVREVGAGPGIVADRRRRDAECSRGSKKSGLSELGAAREGDQTGEREQGQGKKTGVSRRVSGETDAEWKDCARGDARPGYSPKLEPRDCKGPRDGYRNERAAGGNPLRDRPDVPKKVGTEKAFSPRHQPGR